MRRKAMRERGAALVMVLVFTGALMLLGAALLTYSFNEIIIADYHAREAVLYYIAEAGLEAGIAALRQDFNRMEGLAGELAEGHFTVVFSDISPERRLITSTATEQSRGFVKTVSAELLYEPAGGEDEADAIQVVWIKPDTAQ